MTSVADERKNNFCTVCGESLEQTEAQEKPQYARDSFVSKKDSSSFWDTRKIIFLTLIAVVVFVLTGLIGYKIAMTVQKRILKLDAPPDGYEQLVGERFEEISASFKETEPQTVLESFYEGDGGYRQIIIAHESVREVAIFGSSQIGSPPMTKDLEEMKYFVKENIGEIEEDLQEMYADFGAECDILVIEAIQLDRDGFCGVHASIKVPRSQNTLVQDLIQIYRDGVVYGVTAQNQLGEVNDDEVEYLIENLYFE